MAHRRSGGITPRLGLTELTLLYQRALADVHSLDDFRASQLRVDFDAIVTRDERAKWMALPEVAVVRGREVPIDYDVEDVDGRFVGVARLRLPEKLARTLSEEELPTLDRPIRFTVLRGPRGAVRATTLDELQFSYVVSDDLDDVDGFERNAEMCYDLRLPKP